MAVRSKVSCDPTATWGGVLQASGSTDRANPWLRAEVFQGDNLVYAQYVKGASGAFNVGPTPSADESQPGEGTVQLGYWAKNGTFRGTASAKFNVTA